MKVVIQRTSYANVKIEKETIGEIDKGLVVLVGITDKDTETDSKVLVEKLIHLRIFEDDNDKMNLSLLDVKGSILSISQFTLYADIRKGRRPSFVDAAHPEKAKKLYDLFNKCLIESGVHVETGEFGAMMDVELVNHGPVTITMESRDGKLI